jgi:hypothetical protein
MSLKNKVFAELKAKAKSFGFSKKELESAAATIADNLDLDENASDEEIATAATEAVDKYLPLLKLSQSAYGRMVKAYKDQHTSDDDSDDSDDNDDDDKTKGKRKSTPKKDDGDDTPEWAKSLMKNFETLTNEVTALKVEKTTTNRREKLNKLLKDTGIFGKTVLKNFDRMSFKDDYEFDEFYADVEQDLKEENQERANKGLEALGEPPAPVKNTPKVEEASDAELDEIANNF